VGTRLDIFPLSDLHLHYFLKGTKPMDTLEEKFLVGSYTPVGCATTMPDKPTRVMGIGMISESPSEMHWGIWVEAISSV